MLTKKEQLLLLEMLLKKKIRKKDQIIFKSIKFYEAMSKLKKYNLVECKTIIKNGQEKVYSLTYPNGWVRANLIAYDKNVDEKYRKVAEEFRVLA